LNNVIKIDPVNPEKEVIRRASTVIRSGGLVAFPTETVYGLGADALNDPSCRKIYQAKGRQSDNPIIVHISDYEQLNEITYGIPDQIMEKMEVIWPGPLTLILKKRNIGDVPTAGLDTVAIRMPGHRVPLELIRGSGVPIAAPSANRSGRPSPVLAEEVYEDLGSKVDLILDGGPAFFGVESTVIAFGDGEIVILRPGAFAAEELKKIFGLKVLVSGETPDLPISPGMKYRHYAPEKELLMGTDEGSIERFCRENDALFIGSSELAKSLNCESIILGSRNDLFEVARNLFSSFRKLDRSNHFVGVIECFEERGIGLAIMNRIRKATGGKKINF
jgi:L-threonylcarbamoyladenylate synthase